MFLLFLVLLARFVRSDDITLTFTQQAGAIDLGFYGKAEATITNAEARAFDLMPFRRCRYRLTKRFGKRPDYCYFGRTEYEKKIYDRFGFEGVTSVYTISKATSLYVVSDSEKFEGRTFDNAAAGITLTETVPEIEDQGVTTILQRSMNRFGPVIPVKTVVKFFGLSDDDANATYVYSWGENVFKSFPKTYTRGIGAQVEVPAKSGLSLNATSYRTTYAWEIVYQNDLNGVVMADYINPWRKIHYWTYDASRLADGPRFYKEIVKLTYMNEGVRTIVAKGAPKT